jgi:hypothetical protein
MDAAGNTRGITSIPSHWLPPMALAMNTDLRILTHHVQFSQPRISGVLYHQLLKVLYVE